MWNFYKVSNLFYTMRPYLIISKNKKMVFRSAQKLAVSRFCSTDTVTSIPYTSEKFPSLNRGPYSCITDDDIIHFTRILPDEELVLTDESDTEPFNIDWIKTVRGAGKVVLRPSTTTEVSEILKYCNSRKLAVVPQGGNTSLVGGSVPVFDEIVISTQLMNNVIDFNEMSGVMVCQAGCILENLDQYLSTYNHTVPLDLGAKGSCHIGGNISTNAGGIRLLRYGSLRGTVLGIEAVLANGEIVDCLSRLRKDNTGYDIKQLFIGSEGTLGFVTAVSILCPKKPFSKNVLLLGLESFDKTLSAAAEAKADLGEILSALEFMDNESLVSVKQNLHLDCPITDSPFYVLIETSGSSADHDVEKLNSFVEKVLETGLVSDGTIVSEPSKVLKIWSLRERITEALLHDGYIYKYDISIPLEKFYSIVELIRDKIGDLAIRTIGYGHLGDGNLHLNITSKKHDPKLHELIEPFVYDWTSENHGSISAEHGLGFAKRNYIYHSKSRAAVNLMQQLKASMDPNAILNPYKTIPSKSL